MTLNSRFQDFIFNYINLNKNKVSKARNSRDWLIQKISEICINENGLPVLNGNIIHFGSFNRKTKIKPLDDIDLMIVFHAEGNFGNIEDVNNIMINVGSNTITQQNFQNEDGTLNSIKLLNKMKSELKNIPQYSNSDLKRNQEAIVLNLQSSDWSYDLVPAFKTKPLRDDKEYFVIPDGNGNWKRTQPIFDKEYTTYVNGKYCGKILEKIRIMKYINNTIYNQIIPSSYLIECMILDYYNSNFVNIDDSLLMEISNLCQVISTQIFKPIFDPKGIQGDLNTLDIQLIDRISNKFSNASIILHEACVLEEFDDDFEKAVDKVQQVFGKQF